MKNYLICAFLVISVSVLGQTVGIEKAETDSISQIKLTGETYFEIKGYKGEQFFNKVWMRSDILLSTGNMVFNENVKYNGLFDELIWANDFVNQQIKLDKSLVNEFWLKNEQGQTTHFKRIILNKPSSTNQPVEFFAEIVVEGKLSLVIQRKISVVNTEEVAIDGILCRQETIRATPLYYLKLPSNSYILLDKIRLKSLMQLFPEHKKEIAKLMKDNKLKFKTESDLVKLITLLNDQIF